MLGSNSWAWGSCASCFWPSSVLECSPSGVTPSYRLDMPFPLLPSLGYYWFWHSYVLAIYYFYWYGQIGHFITLSNWLVPASPTWPEEPHDWDNFGCRFCIRDLTHTDTHCHPRSHPMKFRSRFYFEMSSISCISTWTFSGHRFCWSGLVCKLEEFSGWVVVSRSVLGDQCKADFSGILGLSYQIWSLIISLPS